MNTNRIQRGFTLVEMITVIAILALMSGALASGIRYFYVTNDYVLQEGTAVESARIGLTTAMDTLREASYGDDGSYPLATAATSSVSFYANVDTDSSIEAVRFYLLNGTLYEGVTNSAGTPPVYTGQSQATSTIATYVSNGTSTPIFQYYDNNGNLLSSPINISSVASIGTTLKIDVDPKRAPVVYTLIGTATLRNLRNH